MDVTRENFLNTLPKVEESILNCDFIAIDTELSGLRKSNGKLFDEHEERYEALRDGCMGYSVIQLGLSCFKHRQEDTEEDKSTADEEDKNFGSRHDKWQCDSYNFYVFPYKVSGLPKQIDRNIEIQASAVQFLRNNGFSFDELFDKGIGWLNNVEEQEVKNMLSENLARSENTDSDKKAFAIPAEHQDFVNNVIQQIEAFVQDDTTTTDDKLDLPSSSPFERKMVYEAVKSSPLNSLIEVQTCKGSSSREQYLSVCKSNKEAKAQKVSNLLTEGCGISRVIQCLTKSQKPLVGHNFLLDIMHLIDQFLYPLPKSYLEFKEMVRCLFPIMYDTKFISNTSDFKDLIKCKFIHISNKMIINRLSFS